MEELLWRSPHHQQPPPPPAKRRYSKRRVRLLSKSRDDALIIPPRRRRHQYHHHHPTANNENNGRLSCTSDDEEEEENPNKIFQFGSEFNNESSIVDDEYDNDATPELGSSDDVDEDIEEERPTYQKARNKKNSRRPAPHPTRTTRSSTQTTTITTTTTTSIIEQQQRSVIQDATWYKREQQQQAKSRRQRELITSLSVSPPPSFVGRSTMGESKQTAPTNIQKSSVTSPTRRRQSHQLAGATITKTKRPSTLVLAAAAAATNRTTSPRRIATLPTRQSEKPKSLNTIAPKNGVLASSSSFPRMVVTPDKVAKRKRESEEDLSSKTGREFLSSKRLRPVSRRLPDDQQQQVRHSIPRRPRHHQTSNVTSPLLVNGPNVTIDVDVSGTTRSSSRRKNAPSSSSSTPIRGSAREHHDEAEHYKQRVIALEEELEAARSKLATVSSQQRGQYRVSASLSRGAGSDPPPRQVVVSSSLPVTNSRLHTKIDRADQQSKPRRKRDSTMVTLAKKTGSKVKPTVVKALSSIQKYQSKPRSSSRSRSLVTESRSSGSQIHSNDGSLLSFAVAATTASTTTTTAATAGPMLLLQEEPAHGFFLRAAVWNMLERRLSIFQLSSRHTYRIIEQVKERLRSVRLSSVAYRRWSATTNNRATAAVVVPVTMMTRTSSSSQQELQDLYAERDYWKKRLLETRTKCHPSIARARL